MTREELEIKPADLKSRLDAGTAPVLIDVRTEQEWGINRLPGAVLRPLDRFAEVLDEYERDAEIVLYCHHGVRSLNATVWMLQNGFSNVKSLAGGIELWAQIIDPSVPRY